MYAAHLDGCSAALWSQCLTDVAWCCQMHAAMEDRDKVQRENVQLHQEVDKLQQEKEDLVQDNVMLQQQQARLERENASIWEDYEKGAAQMKVRWMPACG